MMPQIAGAVAWRKGKFGTGTQSGLAEFGKGSWTSAGAASFRVCEVPAGSFRGQAIGAGVLGGRFPNWDDQRYFEYGERGQFD